MYDVIDARGVDVEIARQAVSADGVWCDEFLGKNFAGKIGSSFFDLAMTRSSGSRRFRRLPYRRHATGSRSPLVIDADPVLSDAILLERFEPIAGGERNRSR